MQGWLPHGHVSVIVKEGSTWDSGSRVAGPGAYIATIFVVVVTGIIAGLLHGCVLSFSISCFAHSSVTHRPNAATQQPRLLHQYDAVWAATFIGMSHKLTIARRVVVWACHAHELRWDPRVALNSMFHIT